MPWTTTALIILSVLNILLIIALRMLAKKFEKSENDYKAQNYYSFSWFMVAWTAFTASLFFI